MKWTAIAALALGVARLVLPKFVKNPKSVEKEQEILDAADQAVSVASSVEESKSKK